MSNENADVELFDEWLRDESDVAALVMHQWLRPVEETGLVDNERAVIFPPTYAKPEGKKDADWTGYNIDRFDDGSNVCLIDSVGSQANRMEPIFKDESCKSLVPQVFVDVPAKEGNRKVHLLDAGHRAGDAIVRFASKMKDEKEGKPLGEQLWVAFRAWEKEGNAEPLARIAPTSLVFGVWDSRATQVKLPRIVRSVIRAYNVKQHTRSATFNTPLHYVNEGLIDEKLDKGKGDQNPLSQEGFLYSLASGTHGGVEVMGKIRRDASINLVALRNLGITQKEGQEVTEATNRVLRLRRYILGLALVALTHRNDQQFNLREGCLLRIAKSSTWKAVPFEGAEEDISANLSSENAIAFARGSARDFGVQKFDKPFQFDKVKAENWVGIEKKKRDKLRRKDAVIKQNL